MFPKIRIISDAGDVYAAGSIIGVDELINAYEETTNDKSLCDWLCRVPTPTAVKFIADGWGIDYEFV